MFHISLLTLLATNALASPLLTSESNSIPRSPSSEPSHITACEAADNCETYIESSSGQVNIRFKSGMEPGTEDYNNRVANPNVKRDDSSVTTSITVGDATMLWGCDTDPVVTLGNLTDICASSGSCISNAPYTDQVTYVTPGQNAWSSETLTISAVGQYPDWMRNGIVEGVQAVMGVKGVINTQTANYGVLQGAIGKNGGQTAGYSCQVATAPSFIGINVWNAPVAPNSASLAATISVTATVGTPGSGFCGDGVAQTAALTGAVVGAFGPVGAGIAALFGTISATCSLSPP